ncbi:MAG: hypothetical protein HDR20_15280 [Lachnospiraceae bacterium]|nr:hypothetical protein [Lachnospiraceae bacterium]
MLTSQGGRFDLYYNKKKRQKYTLFDSIDFDDFQKVAIAYSGENQFFGREVNHANNDEWLGVYPFYTNVQKEGVKLYGIE